MTVDADRFTVSMGQLRPREVMHKRPGRIRVRVTDSAGTRELALSANRLCAGAHESNEIVLHDGAASGTHIELQVREGGVLVRDLRSKNGTWIGHDVRVEQVVLSPGAAIRAGTSTITLLGVDDVDIPVSTLGRFGEMVGPGPRMNELFSRLHRIGPLALDVLVVGETGTGKELVARGLHEHSPRGRKPFIVVDCPNLNEGIAESILFGHARGSFTGATQDQPGLLEQADGGTLFIDEVGELPLSLQPKLLRALERHETRRVGESHYRPFDARVIAATHRDLRSMANTGDFRADLFFRLAQLQVDLPPLRERAPADVHELADLFLERYSEHRSVRLSFDRDAYEALAQHTWPGNVRELRNMVRCAAMLAEGPKVAVADFPELRPADPAETAGIQAGAGPVAAVIEGALDQPFAEAKRTFARVYVQRVLAAAEGNQSEAARMVGMSRSSFRELMKRAGLL